MMAPPCRKYCSPGTTSNPALAATAGAAPHAARRPDLFARLTLSAEDEKLLAEGERPRRSLRRPAGRWSRRNPGRTPGRCPGRRGDA